MSDEPIHHPHDKLFKGAFGQPANAAGFLRWQLPAALASNIDWDHLKLQPGSFVDSHYRHSESDLLFSAPLKESGECLIYLLFEHQSHAEPLMPYRMLRYVDRALWSHVSANGKALPLPAVIPILLHHSESGWKNATSMHQLFDGLA